jgi:hypothetical protein
MIWSYAVTASRGRRWAFSGRARSSSVSSPSDRVGVALTEPMVAVVTTGAWCVMVVAGPRLRRWSIGHHWPTQLAPPSSPVGSNQGSPR